MAWHPLGWKPAFFSEIEKFPRAVLQHHYPHVPLHGDFTTIKGNEYGAIDLLCGGTPCQSFSVAGLRKGLADDRGNLTLEFIRLAERTRARWLVWENVPGVLSSNGGKDFAAFLGGLAECGYGFAYRVLDAQYFGVPQRRRRVVLVGYLGDWRPPAAVLFERESLRGDITPSRKAGQGVAAYTKGSFGSYSEGCGTLRAQGGDLGGGSETLAVQTFDRQSSGEYGTDPVASTISARDYKSPSDLVSYGIPGNWIGRQPENGGNAVEPMHDVAPCLTKTDRHGVVAPITQHGDIAGALTARHDSSPCADRGMNVVAQAFAQNTRDELRYIGGDGQIAGALGAETGMKQQTYLQLSHPAIGWSEELTASVDLAGTLQRGGEGGRHDGVMTPAMQVRRLTPRECERLQGFPDDYTNIPITPPEWATQFPDRVRYSADLNRYKAIGNSWAVPKFRWIGERIQMVQNMIGENK